ncbi:MAG: heme ABC transporter ATP-binding protein [Pseudomonadota bacterium]
MSLRAYEVSVVRNGNRILSGASVAIRAGELVVVVGPNGAGKSTLMAALAGDIPVSSGTVSLCGENLQEYSLEALAGLRAVVGQPPQLAFNYTVKDVVALGWVHGERYGPEAFHLALTSVIDACELTNLAHRTYMTLSSGERQRAEYARASMQLWRPATNDRPRWLLLDEPTANLDVAHGVSMLESLAARARSGDGVLAVIHDLDLAARFADRVVLMNNGGIEAVGSPQDVLAAQRLTEVYGTPIHVEHHETLQRLVVIG